MVTRTVETFRGRTVRVKSIDSRMIVVSGYLPRIASMRDEPFDCISDPPDFIARLRTDRVGADILTFTQELADTTPRHPYHIEWDTHAVVEVSTYDHWWKKQINDKCRNMIRKAQKNGVEIRQLSFTDELVAGIVKIYNETPIRQGKAFWHYGKDFETIKRDHATFLDRSQFIGAFHENCLIGFAKLVRSRDVFTLMQIISTVADRDKAPTNALIAKAVSLCADLNVPYLHYGVWSKGGLGLFKTAHAFVPHRVPRYFVPLNLMGRCLLGAGLHAKWSNAVPDRWREPLTTVRDRWNAIRLGLRK